MQFLYRCFLSCRTAAMICQAAPTSAQSLLPPSLSLPSPPLQCPVPRCLSMVPLSWHSQTPSAGPWLLLLPLRRCRIKATQTSLDSRLQAWCAWLTGWRGLGTTNECTELPCARTPSSAYPTDAPPFSPPLQILLAVAVWFAMWLLRPNALAPHFAHCRLRLRGQLTLLLKHRRWAGWVCGRVGWGGGGGRHNSFVFCPAPCPRTRWRQSLKATPTQNAAKIATLHFQLFLLFPSSRRTWIVATTLSALDSFGYAFVASMLFRLEVRLGGCP